MPNKKKTIEQIVQEVQAPQPLSSVYLPKAEPQGHGGRMNAQEAARRHRTTFKDVVSNPLLYASKAQEKALDSVIDAGKAFLAPKTFQRENEERLKANEALPDARKPKTGTMLEGMVVKGLGDQAVTEVTSVADWLIGNALKELGWENNPISNLNQAMQANKAANEAYYAKNMANASKTQRVIEELGTSAMAALPDLVIAFLTQGGSLAAEGMGALAKGGAKLAGREAAAQSQNVVRRVAGEMYRNPQFWTSFSRAAGASYEQAKADGASDWETNMYVLANGIMNAAVEVGGGIQTMPQEMRRGGKAVWDWIKSSADEGKEEAVQGVIERALQNLMYGKNNPLVSTQDENAVFNPATSAKEFGGGFAVGSILGAGPMISNVRAGADVEKSATPAQKAAPSDRTLRTPNPLPTAAQQNAVEVLQEVMAGNPVTEQGIRAVLKDKQLARQWMQAMGQETAEDISDADLEMALRQTMARVTGQEDLTMDAETKARYDAAETDTAKTGILAGASEEAIGTAERLGQILGRKIVFFAESGNRNGYYDPRTGTLHLNAKSENPVAQIVAHELTHSTEMAEAYADLSQIIMRKLRKDGNLDALQAQIRETYSSNGVELEGADLDHEVVAHFVEHNLLTDEASITSLVQEDRTLAQRIMDMLDRLLAKLGSKNAQERAFIQQARDLYSKALEGSSVTSTQQLQELRDQLRRGEITEEEYDEAFDRAYNAEDALRADVQNSFSGFNDKAHNDEEGLLSLLRSRLNDVKSMDPVAAIDGTELPAASRATDRVMEFLKSINNQAFRQGFGRVLFSKSKVRGSLLGHGFSGTKLELFAAVPDVIEKGKQLASVPNWKGRGYDSFVFAGPVNYKGDTVYVSAIVIRDNENRYYLHEALDEKGNVIYKNKESPTPASERPPEKTDTLAGNELPKVIVQEEKPSVNSNPLPKAKSSTLRNSFSAPSETEQGVVLPKTGDQVQTANQQQSTQGVMLPKAGSSKSNQKLFDSMPEKAQSAARRAVDYCTGRVSKALGVPKAQRSKFVSVAVMEASDEYLRIGSISKKTRDRLYNGLYKLGNTAFEDYHGEEAELHRRMTRNDFEASMDQLASDLYWANRRAKKDVSAIREPVTNENAPKAYQILKEQRREFEKASAMLTEAEERALARVLRGEITLEELSKEQRKELRKERDVRPAVQYALEKKRAYEDTARAIREYRAGLKESRRNEANEYLGSILAWEDKGKPIGYDLQTAERNIRDVIKDKNLAQRVYDKYFWPVKVQRAAANRAKNAWRKQTNDLKLSRDAAKGNLVSEAHAVQLLGEAMDNMRYLEQHKQTKTRDGKTYEEWKAAVENLWRENPNMDRGKIEGAVQEFRTIYDELFQLMNESRVRNGFEPVDYRQGYFPHFQPRSAGGLLSSLSQALGINAEITSLPTTINGLTHTFRPGIKYFSHTQERIGFNTTYDAIEGFDQYIEGAAEVIYMTDVIQNFRALSDQIRYRATDEGMRKEIDKVNANNTLTEEQKQAEIQRIHENAKYHLSNFVVWLEEYTNILAGKRSNADRNMERLLGRNAYNVSRKFFNRVGANMVAINPGSWLTNLIPLTQAWTTTDTRYLVAGMWDSLRNANKSDGFVNRSDFLTNRRGSDPLVKMWEQSSDAAKWVQKGRKVTGKLGDLLASPMEIIDNFASEAIVRGRYNQNLARGMSEAAAMKEADAYTSGLMADRSKGSMPLVFEHQNPLYKTFTQFQLEVNNQLQYIVKDLPDELKEKTLGAAALSIFKGLIGAWIFNQLFKELTGRNSALDPLGIINDTVGDFTGMQLPGLFDLDESFQNVREGKSFLKETRKKDKGKAIDDAVERIGENVPFVGGLIGGGRVPISSAIGNPLELAKIALDDNKSGARKKKELAKEAVEPLSYLVLPFGGSQLRKMNQVAGVLNKGGSYTVDKEGNDILQYPVHMETAGEKLNAAKAFAFGKTSLPTAREWSESGYKSFSKKETAAYQNLTKAGVSSHTAYQTINDMRNAKGETDAEKNQEKRDILRKAKLTDDQKQAVYKTLLMDKDSKQDEKFTAMRKAGMTWDQVMDTYEEYKKQNEAKGDSSARATQFAKWVDDHLSEKQAAVVKEQLKIWAMMPANTDRYEELRGLDVESSDAVKLSETLAALEPEEGKSQPTDIQKYQAIVNTNISDEAKAVGIKSVMKKDVLPKYEAAEKYNISPDNYVAAYAKVIELKQKYGKSSVNASIAKEAIDSIPGLTKKQRAALWQVQKKDFNPSKNPYDVTVGQVVYNIQYGLDGNAVVLP